MSRCVRATASLLVVLVVGGCAADSPWVGREGVAASTPTTVARAASDDPVEFLVAPTQRTLPDPADVEFSITPSGQPKEPASEEKKDQDKKEDKDKPKDDKDKKEDKDKKDEDKKDK